MNRKSITRFYRAIRLVNDHSKKGSGSGALGPPHLRPRRHGQDRKAGPLEGGRTSNELNFSLQGVSRTGNGDSFVSDGRVKSTFSRAWLKDLTRVPGHIVAVFCCLCLKSHAHERMSCRTSGLIAHLFVCRTALLLYLQTVPFLACR